MARESKRKRDERRFGRAERLVDKLATLPRGIPEWFRDDPDGTEFYKDKVESVISGSMNSQIFDVNNVTRYFFDVHGGKAFDWKRDIPCCLPPYPFVFLETDRPANYVLGDKSPVQFPAAWGWLIETYDRNGKSLDLNWPGVMINFDPAPSGTEYQLAAYLVEVTRWGFIDTGTQSVHLYLDASGVILGEPQFVTITDAPDPAFRKAEMEHAEVLAPPIFLALAFLNCKNVAVQYVNPNPVLDRERRKAGLKPFLRYHTLNIEPMKTVLRTEGGVESVGLKKALHICRGHFATLTRNNKGEVLEKPSTYWRAAHTRGSIDQGIVDKDYRVNPPRTQAIHP